MTIDEELKRRFVSIYKPLKQEALQKDKDFADSNLWEAFVAYAMESYETDEKVREYVSKHLVQHGYRDIG